jgi:hypothetical protein
VVRAINDGMLMDRMVAVLFFEVCYQKAEVKYE